MAAVAAALAVAAAGCTSKTETGYEPHKLGMTDTEIHNLYRPAYSTQSQEQKVPAGIAPGQAGVGL